MSNLDLQNLGQLQNSLTGKIKGHLSKVTYRKDDNFSNLEDLEELAALQEFLTNTVSEYKAASRFDKLRKLLFSNVNDVLETYHSIEILREIIKLQCKLTTQLSEGCNNYLIKVAVEQDNYMQNTPVMHNFIGMDTADTNVQRLNAQVIADQKQNIECFVQTEVKSINKNLKPVYIEQVVESLQTINKKMQAAQVECPLIKYKKLNKPLQRAIQQTQTLESCQALASALVEKNIQQVADNFLQKSLQRVDRVLGGALRMFELLGVQPKQQETRAVQEEKPLKGREKVIQEEIIARIEGNRQPVKLGESIKFNRRRCS